MSASRHSFVLSNLSTITLVVIVSLFVLLAKFPMQVLYFCSGSLRENLFYH